jgi:Flp pilus assembly protein TadG
MFRLNNEKGLATMEFALILPVLTFLVMGIIDFGMLMTSRASMVSASREGARAGILLTAPPVTETEISTVVRNALTVSGWDSGNVASATVTVTGAGGGFGTDLTVTVGSNYSFFVLSKLIPPIADQLLLSASTTMKNE